MKDKRIAIIVLGIIITIAFFGLIAILIFRSIPEQNGELLYLSIGALIGGYLTVVNYFYGSSASSSEKTEMMNNNKK